MFKKREVPLQKRNFVYLFIILVLFSTSCKWVKIETSIQDPKQGYILTFKITAGESAKIERIDYSIGNQSGYTTTVPKTITINTCKSSGTYYTTLTYTAKATYKDGTIKNFSKTIDLTIGSASREDNDRTYVLYIADENDGTINDVRIGWANAFQDEFDLYNETQYYWAQPSFFTNNSFSYVNSADIAIFLGHGSPHEYRAGPNDTDWVDFTNTAYGNFVPCNHSGDCEYLVSGACQMLSLANIGGSSFREFWKHYFNSRFNTRAFTGLQMICGFRTNHHYSYWWFFGWHSSSTDFFKEFAKKLDLGQKVKDAWLDASGDKLDFDDGNNRTAVFYLRPNINNSLITNSNDYIYGNSNYMLDVEYWE